MHLELLLTDKPGLGGSGERVKGVIFYRQMVPFS